MTSRPLDSASSRPLVRAEAKRIARACRKMLVHAAGCTWRSGSAVCAGVDSVSELIEDYVDACNAARLPIRIPRRFR